jgi:hypothetical protein
MATTHRQQRLDLLGPQRIQARDLKLWRRDEARANATSLQQCRCACPTYLGACPLKRETILKHFCAYGRHPRNRGWIEVHSL